MKFDYYVLNTYVPELDGAGPELYAKWTEQVVLAEELGFEGAWFTEHHFGRFGGMLPSPQMLMAALAQHTQRIRLGSAVVLLPMHHPLLIAEETAMLDVLSNGRLQVGVGRGMASQPFRVFGTDPDPKAAQEKLEEQVEMLLAAWTDSPFRWDGKYYQCSEPITVLPRPYQRPHPPVWMPASSNQSHSRWIGRHGFNLLTLPWLQGFEVVRRVISDYREGLREGGYGEHDREVLGYLPAYVAETSELAYQEAGACWARVREVSDEERGVPNPNPVSMESLVAESRLIFGDPDTCRQHVRRICDEISIDRLALSFHFGGMPQDRVLAAMRLFMAEVAPSFAAQEVGRAEPQMNADKRRF